MNIQFLRIDAMEWPDKPARTRQNGNFTADYDNTLTLLLGELEKLGAREATIRADVSRLSVRRDGFPKSDARAEFPGVLVGCVTRSGKTLQFYTDNYQHWKHNLRGIALSLEALRAVSRYGCIHGREEQYVGFSALPPGAPVPGSSMGPEWAASVLLDAARDVVNSEAAVRENPEIREMVYRQAVQRTHPDKGGDADEFREVQAAIEVLRA